MRAPADDEMHLFKDLIAAWSRRQKWRTLYLGGLTLGRNNVGGLCFARHWPHLLCWQWSLNVHPFRQGFDTYRRFSAHAHRHNGGTQAFLILFGWRFSYSRQSYDWMVCRSRKNEALRYIHQRLGVIASSGAAK